MLGQLPGSPGRPAGRNTLGEVGDADAPAIPGEDVAVRYFLAHAVPVFDRDGTAKHFRIVAAEISTCNWYRYVGRKA